MIPLSSILEKGEGGGVSVQYASVLVSDYMQFLAARSLWTNLFFAR